MCFIKIKNDLIQINFLKYDKKDYLFTIIRMFKNHFQIIVIFIAYYSWKYYLDFYFHSFAFLNLLNNFFFNLEENKYNFFYYFFLLI